MHHHRDSWADSQTKDAEGFADSAKSFGNRLIPYKQMLLFCHNLPPIYHHQLFNSLIIINEIFKISQALNLFIFKLVLKTTEHNHIQQS